MVAKTPEYLVNHGKTGALGLVLSPSLERFERGDRVVVQGTRGLTIGVILCEANERHARLLGGTSIGQLIRRVDRSDEAAQIACRVREQQIFDASRAAAAELNLPIEILDSEVALDGRQVIVQYLLLDSCEPSDLIQRLGSQFDIEVWLENLASPDSNQNEAGCGEPDCGRANGGSGCDTCGSGGCSSCGTGKIDMRAYFAHLRSQMEERRTSLL